MEDFGRLITAAFGLDRSWMEAAECRKYAVAKRMSRTPWHYNRDDVDLGDDGEPNGVTGRSMIEVALMICFSCPAQYDCARFAVEGLMRGGTFAMDIGDLFWLQKQRGAVDMIDDAELDHRPVQVHVRQKRAESRLVA